MHPDWLEDNFPNYESVVNGMMDDQKTKKLIPLVFTRNDDDDDDRYDGHHDSSWGDTFGQKVTNKFNYGMDQLEEQTEWTEGANDLMNVVNARNGYSQTLGQAQLEQCQQESWGHKQFAAVEGNRGDYDVNSGIFRPDEKVTAFEDVPSFEKLGLVHMAKHNKVVEIPPQQASSTTTSTTTDSSTTTFSSTRTTR